MSSTPVLRRLASSIRMRLLLWFVLLLLITALASVLVERQILLNRLDARIDRELVEETRELRAIAEGNDPETGEPFGNRVDKIFEVYLQRNIPWRNEAIITFLNGDPFLRSARTAPYRLDQDPELVRRWGSLETTDRGSVSTPAGRVEFLAVPVIASPRQRGVFVTAVFRDRERRDIDIAIENMAVPGGVLVVVGSLLAWMLADRILRPVRSITRTARSISETDLTKRIAVEGSDEIAALAGTFNAMLDRLEGAFRTQKSFLDDVGHELRTPLTIVRGQLETIDAEPEDRQRVMALVMDELGRMSRLVEELLLLARAERPDFLQLDVVDVAALTDEVAEKVRAIAPRQWTVDDVGRGRVVADRQRITQALLQLCQNAVQHTGADGAVALGSSVADGVAVFWVRDTGPGIAEEEQQRIFERFERAGTGRGTSGGTGLGLAIVRAIAEAHHGRMELHSAPGEGATFRLVIPVDQPSDESDEEDAA